MTALKNNYQKDQLLMPISEYVINRMIRQNNFRGVIKPDGSNYFESIKTGERFSLEELNGIYPIHEKLYLECDYKRRKSEGNLCVLAPKTKY